MNKYLILGAIGAGAVLAYLAYRGTAAVVSTAVETAKDAAEAVNPLNHDNVIYGGVNSVGGAVTGDKNWTLGGWIYDITH